LKKRDVLHSLIFLGIFAVLYSCLSIHYYTLTSKERFYRQKLFSDFNRSNPSILILGDSHAQNAIDTQTIGSEYFSLAQSGDNIRQMLLKLDYAVRKKPRIHYILIPTDYHTFSRHRYGNMNFDKPQDHSYDIRLTANLYDASMAGVFVKNLIQYLPLTSADDWEKYFFILTTPKQTEMISEVNYDDLSQSEKDASSEQRVKGHLGTRIVHDELVEVLDRLIDFCRNHNLKIIGVSYPLSKEYIQAARKYDIGKVEKIIQTRCANFLIVLDYTKVFSDEPEYFINEDHLNSKGANAFTEIFKHDVECAILQANRERP
jgi:hypothetical protein